MDYERKYKEALEWMRSLYSGLHGATKEDAEHYFPELKESEDEKTRKELIQFVQSRLAGFPECERFVTWLEKQGEQKPAEKVEPKTLDADKVIEWLQDNVAKFWENPCNPDNIINQFKEDFGI